MDADVFSLHYFTLHVIQPQKKALQRLITDQQKSSNKSHSKEILKTALVVFKKQLHDFLATAAAVGSVIAAKIANSWTEVCPNL